MDERECELQKVLVVKYEVCKVSLLSLTGTASLAYCRCIVSSSKSGSETLFPISFVILEEVIFLGQ